MTKGGGRGVMIGSENSFSKGKGSELMRKGKEIIGPSQFKIVLSLSDLI